MPENLQNSSEKKIVEKVFDLNPEFLTIGSREQYAEYLKTIFPESKMQDIVYHETNGDWFKTENFSKQKIGKNDNGYYGKGFYFSTQEGVSGGYGENTFLGKLNIKNPKYDIDTYTVGKQILSGQSKEESREMAISWLNEQISYYENEITDLKNGKIAKHKDIPRGTDFETYWENERIARIERFSKLIREYGEQVKTIDVLVDEYYSYDGFLTSNETSNYEEVMVREPDQIHILGSETDKAYFKKFVNK